MNLANVTKFLALCILSASLMQCTEVAGITSSNNNNADTQSNPAGTYDSQIVGDNITELELTGDSLALSLDLAEGEEAVLLMVSSDENGDQHGFQLVNSESVAESGFAASTNAEPEDATEEAHEILRIAEEELMTWTRLENTSTGFAAASNVAIDEKTFKVIQSFSDTSQYIEINTFLIYEGNNVNLYLDERDYDALSSEQVSQMVDKAEDFDTRIAPQEHTLFGEPSDVDSNGAVNIVSTREVNEYYNSLGSFVTGYFYAGDTFAEDINPGSNEAEVVFTIVPDADGIHGAYVSDTIYFENIFEGVITHEYQHCINFNERYLQNNASIELPALNEFLSHLSEDLIYNMETTGNENYSRIANGLANLQNIDIFGGTALAQRGVGYLMLRYFYEQAEKGHFENIGSGQDLIRGLITSPFRGVDNLKSILFGDSAADDQFAEWVSRFAITLYLSDTELSDGDYYQMEGLSLRAISNDNRGTYLNGPPMMDLGSNTFTGVLDGVSMAFVTIEESDLSTSGTLYLNVQDTASLNAFLIQ